MWTFRLIVLTVVNIPIWIVDTLALSDQIPHFTSEPGLVVDCYFQVEWMAINIFFSLGILWIIYFFDTNRNMVFSFRNNSFAKTATLFVFIGIVDTNYFHSACYFYLQKMEEIGVTSGLLTFDMSLKQLLLKLEIIPVIYVMIDWLAGYFIAWQNSGLKAFYGSSGEIEPLFTHTVTAFSKSPGLILLQLFIGLIFATISSQIIFGSKVRMWITALLVGSLFAIPHLAHIMPNVLIQLPV